jgi:hypothetical protein
MLLVFHKYSAYQALIFLTTEAVIRGQLSAGLSGGLVTLPGVKTI